MPGLPDDAFDDDGQLTKREVRAVTLSRLAPVPGQLLWDVGGGAGSIGIEWMRAHPTCRAVAVEARADRAERIRGNAVRLGVPGLEVVEGWAPEALAGLPVPDAVFVGGGATVPGVLEDCWAALPSGGRLVANAVTVESEAVLAGVVRARRRRPGAARGAAGAAGRRLQRLEGRHARDHLVGGQAVTVHFIGAGPGAADLITLRAARIIAAAPVCLYAGALVPRELLDTAPPGARLVDTADLDLDAITAELVAAHEARSRCRPAALRRPVDLQRHGRADAPARRRRRARTRWSPASRRSPRPPRPCSAS